ncbi:hypothetical protein L1I30_02525 [Gillisia sp. M10.2A]|uniref:Uncharacterized protein n=1 Tax=Gillisia lutea TaxID=2909668 RepID=A0ABS9EGI5_9FLAO|nr:hypothetical protein [Gillisia lutea]MCF4100533.1 hypothetical protein [Gillisia lutea]
MDNSSATIGLLLLVAFIGPILFMIYKQSNKDKKRLKELKNLSAQHNMNLDHIELSNLLILGLDSKSKKLIVMEPENNMSFNVIDLQDTTGHISQKGIPLPNAPKNKTAITHISLELLKNKKEKVTEIVFYDEDDNNSLNAETQLFIAGKWEKLISTSLSA